MQTVSQNWNKDFKNVYYIRINELESKLAKQNKHLIDSIMAKGKDAKKNVKKEPAKTAKEKKAEKRLKKSKKD